MTGHRLSLAISRWDIMQVISKLINQLSCTHLWFDSFFIWKIYPKKKCSFYLRYSFLGRPWAASGSHERRRNMWLKKIAKTIYFPPWEKESSLLGRRSEKQLEARDGLNQTFIRTLSGFSKIVETLRSYQEYHSKSGGKQEEFNYRTSCKGPELFKWENGWCRLDSTTIRAYPSSRKTIAFNGKFL